MYGFTWDNKNGPENSNDVDRRWREEGRTYTSLSFTLCKVIIRIITNNFFFFARRINSTAASSMYSVSGLVF